MKDDNISLALKEAEAIFNHPTIAQRQLEWLLPSTSAAARASYDSRQKILDAAAVLMSIQLRQILSRSIHSFAQFFSRFDNSTLEAKRKEQHRSGLFGLQMADTAARISEDCLSGEGVGTGDGMYSFKPRGSDHARRYASKTHILLAALAHARQSAGDAFQKRLLLLSEKPPESLLRLTVSVKRGAIYFTPTMERVEEYVMQCIDEMVSSLPASRVKALTACHDGRSKEGGHGQLPANFELLLDLKDAGSRRAARDTMLHAHRVSLLRTQRCKLCAKRGRRAEILSAPGTSTFSRAVQ